MNRNLLEQIHHQIENLYGTRQRDEYFTLVCKGPQIHSDRLSKLASDSITRMVEEDALTNCLCAPSQIVSDVLPYRLSSRLNFALSMWIARRQIYMVQDGVHIYQSEDVFYETIRGVLQRAFEIDRGICADFDVTDVDAWKMAYNSLWNAGNCLYEHCIQRHDNTRGFGEEELLEARDRLKSQRKVTPDNDVVYPIRCIPDDWSEHLSTCFQKQDELPSMYDIMNALFTQSSLIEEQVKKLMLFEADSTDTIASGLRQLRFELLENIAKLTNDWDSHDQQLIFLIAGAFRKPYRINAHTMRCLQKFFNKKESPMRLRSLIIQLEEEQTAYWKLLREAAAVSYSDTIRKELCSNLQIYLDMWETQRQQLYQVDRTSLMTQNIERTLLPENRSDDYDSLICSAPFSAFYEDNENFYDRDHVAQGLMAFFGTHIPYGIDEEKMKQVHISLGCLMTQVEIQRPWMMEELFDLSFTYHRLCHEPISQGIKKLQKINKKAILPAYPIRMVIAKDVTIRLDFTQAGKEMMRLVRKSAVHGKGFLCFLEDTSSFTPYIENNGLIMTLRYPKAYILGYFMRFTPEDKAKKIGGI